MGALLEKAKIALRIVTTDFDIEIMGLIEAAKADLGIAGVELPETLDAICEQAIITYCKLNFGELDKDVVYRRLKDSYDEQKAKLSMATGYTKWTEAE